MTPSRRVALVTLGCGRNDSDSEELAGRLAADGFEVVAGADQPGLDAVVVNTCGFIAAAKKDSIDTVLAAADTGLPVLAVGCLAERYGRELAEQLPEARAVLGFDTYPAIGAHVRAVLAGHPVESHAPRDRRALLPLAPAERGVRDPAPRLAHRQGPLAGPRGAGSGSGGSWTGQVTRQRLDTEVGATLKLASGCDRRCAFCAIPKFRGAFVSRRPEEIMQEAGWLAARGVRELQLVSENSTSYGKDFGDLRALERLLPELAAVPGIVRVRVAYLQPAEVRPSLLDVLLGTPAVAPYLDLSFQHASGPLLRRMRRFGDTDRFLALLADARGRAASVGVRSNVIVGFPGEKQADVRELERFLIAARLDAVGVFPYSDEDGTEAAGMVGKVPTATVRRREARISGLVEELTAARAEERVGSSVEVLVERVDPAGAEGHAAHQGPEVDGNCQLTGPGLRPGDLVLAQVRSAEGVDLQADVLRVLDRAPAA